MKILTALTAGLIAITGFAAAPAAAAPAPTQDRVVVRERTVTPVTRNTRVVVRDRTTVRRGYGYRRAPRRVCTVRYRRGERIRTCRRVYRRY